MLSIKKYLTPKSGTCYEKKINHSSTDEGRVGVNS